MSGNDIANSVRRHSFWDFNVTHLLMLLAMAGAFLVWWTSFGSLPKQTADAVVQLSIVMKDMNEKGTFGSRNELTKEQGQISSLDSRVTKLEGNYNSLNEKITDVQSKLSVIASLLEADKRRK